MVKILQKDDPILRKKAALVRKEEIGTPKLDKILSDMKEAIVREADAVAIAAPQIGQSLRIFVVAGRVIDLMAEPSKPTGQSVKNAKKTADLIFINPEIVKISKAAKEVEEGCLSVRYLYGKVKRGIKATVRALNERGEPFERGGSGLLAQIFQHETDHLNGVLFIDKAKNLKNLPPDAAS
jgi:peptide deformylase